MSEDKNKKSLDINSISVKGSISLNLPAKKVRVKFAKTHSITASQDDADKVIYHSTGRNIICAKDRNGNFITPFENSNPEVIAHIESVLKISLDNDGNNLNSYFSKFDKTLIKTELLIDMNYIELDCLNLLDYVDFKIIAAQPYVAGSLKEVKPNVHLFYIEDISIDTANKAVDIRKKVKLQSAIYELSATQKLYFILVHQYMYPQDHYRHLKVTINGASTHDELDVALNTLMEVEKCRSNLTSIMALREADKDKYQCYTLLIDGIINQHIIVGQHGLSLISGEVLGDTFQNAIARLSSIQGTSLKAKLAALTQNTHKPASE